MKLALARGIMLIVFLGMPLHSVPAQEGTKTCISLDPQSALRLIPDKVPLETEAIPVDTRNLAAIQFPDKTRLAIAPLITSGYATDMRSKYHFILVSETRVYLGRTCLPAGVVGLGLKPEENREALTRTLVARDFTGNEIEHVTLQLDTSRPPTVVSLTPKGEKEFELRFGRYVVQGRQR